MQMRSWEIKYIIGWCNLFIYRLNENARKS